MKRACDIILSACGLVLLLPLLAVLSALILAWDGWPVFFRQERVGYKGRPFRIWKFRTMTRGAEKIGAQLTVGQDPRITRLGHWLRKFKLDELPQLLNVLVGEMSLVGPRPEVERYVKQYTAEQRRVLDLVPGVTDAASIRYRHESEMLAQAEHPEQTYVDLIVPEKIRLNLEYAQRASILRDFAIILQTLSAIVVRS
jgi:lipopolysaccharide/colanic/teichoic acid biosynthesis glycosyltransferase